MSSAVSSRSEKGPWPLLANTHRARTYTGGDGGPLQSQTTKQARLTAGGRSDCTLRAAESSDVRGPGGNTEGFKQSWRFEDFFWALSVS